MFFVLFFIPVLLEYECVSGHRKQYVVTDHIGIDIFKNFKGLWMIGIFSYQR